MGAFFVVSRQPVSQWILSRALSGLMSEQGLAISAVTATPKTFNEFQLKKIEFDWPAVGISGSIEDITLEIDWTQFWRPQFIFPMARIGSAFIYVDDINEENAPTETWRRLNDEPHLIPLFFREKIDSALSMVLSHIGLLVAQDLRLSINLKSGTHIFGENALTFWWSDGNFHAHWGASYRSFGYEGHSQAFSHNVQLFYMPSPKGPPAYGFFIEAQDDGGGVSVSAVLGEYFVGRATRQRIGTQFEGGYQNLGEIEWDTHMSFVRLSGVHLQEWTRIFDGRRPNWHLELDADVTLHVETLDSLQFSMLGNVTRWSYGKAGNYLGDNSPMVEGKNAALSLSGSYAQDVLRIESSKVRDAYSHLGISGEIDARRGEIRLELMAPLFDFRSLHGHIADMRFSGAGWVGGTIFGAHKNPIIIGQADLKKFGLSSFNIDQISGHIRFENDILAVSHISALSQGSKITGYYQTDFDKNAFTVIDATTERTSMGAILSLWDDLPKWPGQVSTAFISGDVAAEFHLQGSLQKRFRDQLLVNYALRQSEETFFLGNPVNELKISGQFAGGSLSADVFDVAFLDGLINLFCKFNFISRKLLLSGHWDIPRAKIEIPTYEEVVEANLKGKLHLHGQPKELAGIGELQMEMIRYGDRVLPDLKLTVEAAHGLLHLKAPEIFDIKEIDAVLQLNERAHFKLKSRIDVVPGVISYKPIWFRKLQMILAAKLEFFGELFDWKTWNGSLRVDNVRANYGGIVLTLDAPTTFNLTDGDWALQASLLDALGGEYRFGGYLRASGYDLTLDSNSDISAFRIWQGWGGALEELEGRLLANLSVRGPLGNPEFSGAIHISTARLKFEFLRLGISVPELNIVIDKNHARLSGDANIEDGFVNLSGRWQLFTSSAENWFQCSFKRLPIDWYSWGRGVASGHLKYLHAPKPVVSGNVDIANMVIQKEVDFETFIRQVENKVYIKYRGDSAELDWQYNIAANVAAASFENTRLLMLFSGDVRVVGSRFQPDLLGTLKISGGYVFFRGNRYTLDAGKMDFVDGMRAPYLDFSAETKIGDYDIWLKLAGTHRNPQLWVKSDPYLKEEAILSMMTLGVLRPEINKLPELASGAGMELLSWASGFDQVLYRMLPSVLKNRDSIHVDTLKLTSHNTYFEGLELPAILMGVEIAHGLKLRFQSTLFNSENLWGRKLELEQRLSEFLRWRIVWESQEGMPIGDAGIDFWYRWEF